MKIIKFILLALVLILIALFAIQLASRKSIDLAKPDYTKYEFKKDKQNAKPIENPLPYFFPKGFKMVVWMDSTAYWSQSDWWVDDFEGYDRDWHDWNKGKGITNAFTPNNHQSAMIVWRPGVEHNTWEFSGYTNYPGSKFTYETKNALVVKYGQPVYAQCLFVGKAARYMLTNGVDTVRVEHPFKRPLVAREVGTWIGGANNEPGPFGGEASKDMIIYIDFVKY